MDIFKKHPQWADVKKICTKLRENGFTAWLAGGCVRDGLLDIMPKDFDIVTNARPKKIESFFNKTVDVGKAFGVIKVIEQSGEIEVATFRKDGPYSDGRRPDNVEVSTPQEDAKRRDFTINAIFYDIFEGEIFDYVEGVKDLKARLIRTVGIPEDRFMEDKLRVLRAVRFVSQLDFDIEGNTLEAVSKFSSSVTQVSWERIHDELSKLFAGKRLDKSVELLTKTGLLDVLFPEVLFKKDELIHFSQIMGKPDQLSLAWLLLISQIHSVDKQAEFYKKMRFSNERMNFYKNAIDICTSLMIFDRLSIPEKRRISAEREVLWALDLLELRNQIEPEVRAYVMKNRALPPRLIEAQDIMALGVKPGKELGDLLEKAYDAQLEEKFLNRGDALRWIKKNLKTI